MHSSKNNLDAAQLISWHDGVLRKIEICFDIKPSLRIVAAVYESDQSKHREEVRLEFFEIDDLVTSFSFFESIYNLSRGNVSDGYIKSHKRRLRFFIYFSDGFMSFYFKKVEVSKNVKPDLILSSPCATKPA